MKLGKILKELRTEKGFTLTKMAKDLNVDRTTLGKYENSTRTPDVFMLCLLADYFGVTVDYLLGREQY